MATDLTQPIAFVDDNPETWLKSGIAHYEGIAGRTLGNADPERLMISSFALQLAQLCSQINTAGNQNLLRFANGIALEQIGYKFGVYRLDAAPAKVVLEFTIAGTTGSVFFPAGTRVKSADGAVMFATDEDHTTGTGTDPRTVRINATCTSTGVVGNGYVSGLINVIADPIAYVTAATNVDTSTGGSDDEDDDGLRERISLASATFSVAGPTDAYLYFAKTADPAIVDVGIPDPTPTPGTVYIYPLLDGGVVPGVAVLDAVAEVLSDKKVRPLNDIVVVSAPTEIDYTLVVKLKLKRNAPAGTDALVKASLEGFVNQWGKRGYPGNLQVDVMVDQIKAKCMLNGVYSVTIPSLAADIPVAYNEFAKCTSISVSVDSIVDEP